MLAHLYRIVNLEASANHRCTHADANLYRGSHRSPGHGSPGPKHGNAKGGYSALCDRPLLFRRIAADVLRLYR